ncbi:MAG: hypothetical protein R2864_00070 [Syntrophotaleaceae bacterium]
MNCLTQGTGGRTVPYIGQLVGKQIAQRPLQPSRATGKDLTIGMNLKPFKGVGTDQSLVIAAFQAWHFFSRCPSITGRATQSSINQPALA